MTFRSHSERLNEGDHTNFGNMKVSVVNNTVRFSQNNENPYRLDCLLALQEVTALIECLSKIKPAEPKPAKQSRPADDDLI